MTQTATDEGRFYWRAVETNDCRWQPQWGFQRGNDAIEWRTIGRPRLDQFDAEDSAKKYAEYLASKK